MELAELQTAWRLVDAEIQSRDSVKEPVLAESIHRRSHSELADIKRALQQKFVIGGLVAAISVGASLASMLAPEEFHPLDFIFKAGETAFFYATLAVSLSVMLGFNYRAYRAIKAIEQQAENVRTTLRQFVSVMEKSIRFNIYSDTFMSPIFISWFYYAYAFRDQPLTWGPRAAVLFILPVLVGFLSFYVQRYIQHLKFGQYLERLKTYLKSLDLEKDN